MQRRLSIAVMLVVTTLALAGAACTANPPSGKPAAHAKASPTQADQDYLASLGLSDDKSDAPQEKEAPVFVTVLGFLLKLAVVLGLCYATILGLKKFTNMRGTVGGPARSRIRVLEQSSLGANRSLHLVEIGSKKLLVASTPSQVNLLAELDPSDVPDPEPGQQVLGFKEQLSLFLGNKPDSTQSAGNVARMLRDSNSFMQDKVREVGGLRRTFKNAK
ncbi:MAG: flagellar biosynthetic protein FliO [Armatimonadetes bacterium]|nr:flagellar biosynthetic protein FliO [Armatimonadota bacterium]